MLSTEPSPAHAPSSATNASHSNDRNSMSNIPRYSSYTRCPSSSRAWHFQECSIYFLFRNWKQFYIYSGNREFTQMHWIWKHYICTRSCPSSCDCCSNFDIDFLNSLPCIWPDVGYYPVWLSGFLMPFIFTASQFALYGIVKGIQKLRRKPYCKQGPAKRICCCCPSTTYGLLEFRHRLVKVQNVDANVNKDDLSWSQWFQT